ncbi:PREDICTED: alpha-tocopherol transfer protein-like isoform X2 [Dinoponera quadriceps]|uniref:Alpha-tocopherol transfer protein-like isoform X2 n=1 Tax=Dinoponera quadriceps TaxID=609295 RepID=A0A6P3X8Z1_DINQU|nr:PREDICTED: alpha-tocopherol transfer protein-like isoform X2 [Dinoponera quadriceps]
MKDGGRRNGRQAARMKLGHTISDSRRKCPELTDELLEVLQNWAKERGLPHIPEEQLALFAYSCYFDLQATERCMDVYYRMRTTIPEFFSNRDPRLKYLQHSLKVSVLMTLPKPDQNGYRIIFHRLADTRPLQYVFNDTIKLLLMSIDASLYTDGCSPGYVFLLDMHGVRLSHLPKLSINSIRRFFEYIQEGMPVRLKAVYVLNAVWFMDKVLAFIKPFMKRELYDMLHLYTGDVSDVYPHVPPECLPKDFGGELDCIANLHELHCVKLDELRNYFREEESLFHNYSSSKTKISNNLQITTSNLEEDQNDDDT